MLVSEETLHYAARFLDRYDVQNKQHQDAVKELRLLSNHLIENLYKPEMVNVIRKKRAKED